MNPTKYTLGILFFASVLIPNKLIAQTPIPTQIIESNQADSYYAWAATDAGDINGDGYGDVIVGAYNYDNGQSNEGVVFVYHGSATGLSVIPDAILESNQINANFGRSVSGAGDVNNDGYDDIIVGAWSYDVGTGNEGRVYIYHGSPTGIITTPARIINGTQVGGNLGSCVSKAGDLNNDGYDDIVVSAWVYESGQFDEGRVYVYLGSATGIPGSAIAFMDGNQDWAHFGTSVANAGDINGDGYDDIVVGFELFDNGQTDEGKILFYNGTASGINTTPSAQIESDQAFASLGYDVAAAGDVNNDGYDDVIAGAYRYDNGEGDEGAAFIYHGSSSGIITTPATLLECNLPVSYFGISVSDAGDFNSDGYDDVIVGASLFSHGSSAEGSTFLYKGTASGIHTTPYLVMESDQAFAYLGTSVSTTGDINNDGFDDILTGVNFYDNGETNEGAIFVYHMCADSLYADLDFDGFGDPLNKVNICNELINMVADNTDCDDANADIFPGATEICNSIDDDCNSFIDDGLPFYTFYIDVDADLYGDMNDSGIYTCAIIPEAVLINTDCDDANNLINPGMEEICNLMDDNCSGVADEGIIVTISIEALGATTFCQGSDVVLQATHNGTSLQWKKNGFPIPGATNNTYTVSTNGNYTCQTSSLCGISNSASIHVTVNKNPNANITAVGATTFCPGDSVILTLTPVGGSTYQWYKGANPIPGATSLSYVAKISGNYKCRVTKNATGCFKNSNIITVNATCKEDLSKELSRFNIYPNPTSNNTTIKTNDHNEKTIYLINSLGQILHTITSVDMEISVDLRAFATGIYYVKIKNENGSFMQQIIKQ